MTDKELRRLSRAELIDILYELQKRGEELDAQNQQLRRQLEQRQLHLAEAGSIAEAALRVNGVFEAAQAAADQYLLSVQASVASAEQKVADAERQAEEILRDAQVQAQKLLDDANRRAMARWSELQREINALICTSERLRTPPDGEGETQ